MEKGVHLMVKDVELGRIVKKALLSLSMLLSDVLYYTAATVQLTYSSSPFNHDWIKPCLDK